MCYSNLPFFKRFPNIDEKFPVLFKVGDPGTISLLKNLFDKVIIYTL